MLSDKELEAVAKKAGIIANSLPVDFAHIESIRAPIVMALIPYLIKRESVKKYAQKHCPTEECVNILMEED